jgi:hypothetical protein
LDRLSFEQKEFIENYYKYMPLTYSDSPVNLLCRYIEGINFEINQKIKSLDDSNIIVFYKNKDHQYTTEQYKEIIQVLNNHTNRVKYNKILFEQDADDYGYDENTAQEFKVDNDILEQEINNICSDVYLVTNILLDYFYKVKSSANKDILWSTYGKYIYNNVKENIVNNPKFPFPDSKGEINYLGLNYSLREINIDEL